MCAVVVLSRCHVSSGGPLTPDALISRQPISAPLEAVWRSSNCERSCNSKAFFPFLFLTILHLINQSVDQWPYWNQQFFMCHNLILYFPLCSCCWGRYLYCHFLCVLEINQTVGGIFYFIFLIELPMCFEAVCWGRWQWGAEDASENSTSTWLVIANSTHFPVFGVCLYTVTLKMQHEVPVVFSQQTSECEWVSESPVSWKLVELR